MLLALGTVFCTVAGYYALAPLMAAARAGQGSLSFAQLHGISLASIHSSRTPAGEVHYRIGFDADAGLEDLHAAAQAIDRSGLGRVLEQP